MYGILAVLAIAAAVYYGRRRWRAQTRTSFARLTSFQERPRDNRYDEKEIEGLPDPVRRYFQNVLRPGQELVRQVRHVQSGEFRLGDRWRPLAATQVHSTQPPGFVWDARIRIAPGLSVYVRDTYARGAGSMRAQILGLIPVADAGGTPEFAASALQRYLGEAIWFPTALLPSQGVRWTALSHSEARATLTDGDTTVSLDFRFNAEGEITGAFTGSRYREVAGRFEPTPWECRCSEYAEQGGMRVPLAAEVAWQLAGEMSPYWRARIADIAYD
jgi:hypothetical protein